MIIELLNINWWKGYKSVMIMGVTIGDWDYALLDIEIGSKQTRGDILFILGIVRMIKGKKELKARCEEFERVNGKKIGY